jgi:gamma-glutamyl phosphate reductase
MDASATAETLGRKARSSFLRLQTLSTNVKNEALERIAQKLSDGRQKIVEANLVDLEVHSLILHILHRVRTRRNCDFDMVKILTFVLLISARNSLDGQLQRF